MIPTAAPRPSPRARHGWQLPAICLPALVLLACALTLALALPSAPAMAQSLFSPAVQVNGKIVTWYEIEQRARLFSALNAPGIPEEVAEERLIDERLQVGAAEAMGLSLTEEEITEGETEFAARGEMSREQFIEALASDGIEPQTFRDFIIAGQLWRKAVRERFLGDVQILDRDVERELADTHPSAEPLRLSYAEIILPADTPERKEEAQQLAAQLSKITSTGAFSEAARAYSAAPSAQAGGAVPSVAARDMAPGLVQVLLALGPGQVSDPLPIPDGIALLQLRGVGDGIPPRRADAEVDYALWLIPGAGTAAAQAEAQRVQDRVRSCNELYALNRREKGADARLERHQGPMSGVPRDIALELGRMDPGEFSTAITRSGQLALLMLCSRQLPLDEEMTRDQLRDQLLERRVSQLAEAWLRELRDSAVLRRP